MPEIPDIDRLIAEVAARHGILLKKDDAAFALVTLNQLVLKSVIADLLSQMNAATVELEGALERVQTRAGTAIAKDLRAVVLDLASKLDGTRNSPLISLTPTLWVSWNVLCAFIAGIAVGVFFCWIW